MRFVVDRSKVLCQVIEGEFVIVNLTTGTYYSLRHSGADIWSMVEKGVQQNYIVQALAERYDAPADLLEHDVTRILHELEKEGLIASSAENTPAALYEHLHATVDPSKIPYTSPLIEKFEDMQDLILLDPIHEVDEDKGWPHLKAPN